MTGPVSVYVHIPFCAQRCVYCDFVTYAGQERWMEPYTEAVYREIATTAVSIDERVDVHTVFFGGGTPSYLPMEHLRRIMAGIRLAFDLRADAEISLEANPGTLTTEACLQLRKMGFNRISLGVQSSDDADLRMLGRIHDYAQAVEAVQLARTAGFDNLSLDLIYGLPGQSLAAWQAVVKRTLELEPEHISMYSLTVEEGTPLFELVSSGKLPEPDPDTAADQLEWNCDYLSEMGFQHYEVSNWARSDDLRARHNLQYWLNEPYLGFGAGAHGYFHNRRYLHPTGLSEYVESVRQIGVSGGLPAWNRILPEIPAEERMQDEMMLGLRLLMQGVSEAGFIRKFGQSPTEVFGNQINILLKAGLLEETLPPERGWRLTRRGLLLGNQVFMQFVGED